MRRFVGILPTLFLIVSASFFIVRLAPGGPFDQEQSLPPQIRANLDRLYGLDQPLSVQYLHYLRGLTLKSRSLKDGPKSPCASPRR